MFGEPIFVLLLMLFAWLFTGRKSGKTKRGK